MNDFTVFDIESTGYGADGVKEMIEIGAVKVSLNRVISNFHSFANPNRPITWQARRIHGITDAMVKDAPEKHSVLEQFLQFAENSTLVAHNAKNDIKFLVNAGIEVNLDVLDTLQLSKLASPNERKHDLDTLIERWAVIPPSEGKRHRALFDAHVTALVFLKMLEALVVKYTIQQILSKCNILSTTSSASTLDSSSEKQERLF